jgi:ATP-dependent RNA helicase DeaD
MHLFQGILQGQKAGDADHVSAFTDESPHAIRPPPFARHPRATMNEIFNLDVTFAQLNLSPEVVQGTDANGFKHPTAIQAALIPPVLAGKDVLGQAKTGTGKTAAFGLPILTQATPDGGTQALILAPTRELASQIVHEINDLGQFTQIKAVAVVGGESFRNQIGAIRGGAAIIVGTPGRVMDLKSRGELSFDNIRWAVLDEVDRMLDIGFRDDIRKILSQIKNPHQTIFVSATISPDIEKLARQFMKADVEKISTISKSLTVSLVDQKYVPVKPWDKERLLLHLLKHEEAALTVVFCKTKRKVTKLTKMLQHNGIDAFEIHGDLPQSKRNRIMERLRTGKLEVLVASDLASRGLDVEGITHVINYDLPEDPEVYVHRIGRTARAGRQGVAWSLVTPDQGQMLTNIEILTSVHIQPLEYGDFEHRPQPADWYNERPGDAPIRPAEGPPRNRYAEPVSMPVPEPGEAAQIDPKLFPGGVVPKGPPPKNLGSRFRSTRRR